jgi:membrane protease subunit HflC
MNDGGNYTYNFKPKNADFKKYMGTIKFAGGFILFIILLSIVYNAFTFRVDERQQAVVMQFNKVVKIIVDDDKADELVAAVKSHSQLKDAEVLGGKGLFFKIPFIQKVEYFTNTLLTYDTDVREVTTGDKKKLVLDNYAQWEIVNPAFFAISLKTIPRAHTRIDDIVYSKLNEEIGKVAQHTVVSDKDYVLDMLRRVADSSNEELKEFGIRIADIRIRRTDFPEDNYENIYNRMRTERQRDAATYRSEGKEEAEKIRSEADKQATIIEAQAYEQAQTLMGEGEAEALRIYAEAYNRDPEFYQFWRTLQAYRETLNEGTKIVIDPGSEFAKYLFGTE